MNAPPGLSVRFPLIVAPPVAAAVPPLEPPRFRPTVNAPSSLIVRLPPMVTVPARSRPILIWPPCNVMSRETVNAPVRSLATLIWPFGPRLMPRLIVNVPRFPVTWIFAPGPRVSNWSALTGPIREESVPFRSAVVAPLNEPRRWVLTLILAIWRGWFEVPACAPSDEIVTWLSCVVPARLMAIDCPLMFLTKTWPGPLTVIMSSTPPERTLTNLFPKGLRNERSWRVSRDSAVSCISKNRRRLFTVVTRSARTFVSKGTIRMRALLAFAAGARTHSDPA